MNKDLIFALMKLYLKNLEIYPIGYNSWYLGKLEILLVVGEVINPFFDLPLKKKEVKGWFGRKKIVQESYKQCIVRLAKEYLESNSIK